jgi:hypothetical protein
MKQFIVPLSSAIIVALLIYYLNRRSAELRYQMSSPIDVDASVAGPTKIGQQIEVANAGNATAQRVQIRVRKAVGTIRLTKDSESDKYEQFQLQPEGVEIDYDSLRTGGRIKISITGDSALAEQDLDIRYQDGLGKPALASERSVWSWILTFLQLGIVGFYMWWTVHAIVRMPLFRKCRYHPVEALAARKPVLLSRAKWEESLKKDLSSLAEHQHGESSDVSSWQIHNLLNSVKPKHLPDDVWTRVLPKLVDGFISRLISVAHKSQRGWSDPEAIGRLLALPKPSAVFDEKWTQLKTNLSVSYSLAVVTSTMHYGLVRFNDPKVTFDAIQIVGLDQTEREKMREWLRGLYCASLVKQIQDSSEPIQTINSADLILLSKTDADGLKAFAYQCQMKNVQDIFTPWDADRFLRTTKPAFMSDPVRSRLQPTNEASTDGEESG